MNTTLNFLYRQHGLGFLYNYDVSLGNLAAHIDDCWNGVQPAQELPNFNPDPPLLAAKFASKPSHKHILALANEDGKVRVGFWGEGIFEFPSKNFVLMKNFLNF